MREVLQLLLKEEVRVAWTYLHQFCDYISEGVVPLALLRETGHLCKKLLPHYHLNIIIRRDQSLMFSLRIRASHFWMLLLSSKTESRERDSRAMARWMRPTLSARPALTASSPM